MHVLEHFSVDLPLARARRQYGDRCGRSGSPSRSDGGDCAARYASSKVTAADLASAVPLDAVRYAHRIAWHSAPFAVECKNASSLCMLCSKFRSEEHTSELQSPDQLV